MLLTYFLFSYILIKSKHEVILLKKKLSLNKELFIKIVVILFIILMCVLVFIKIRTDNNPTKIQEEQRALLFNTIDKNANVNVTKYTVYGTHFNIEGTLDIVEISGIKISNVDLIVKNLNGDEISIKSDFNYSDNTISFSTSSEINRGIDLESLEINDYYLLLKVTYSNSDINYYSFVNGSEYGNITYYTLTKNNSNHKIDISFNQYHDIPYLSIHVEQANGLPEDVYDIAIDPGHGGLDAGATSGDYTEAGLVLDCALTLKSKLEDLGLKVLLSRDETSPANENTAYTMYDENGRVNLLNKSHAKLLISLHLNSEIYNKDEGGVEVYAPNDCNLDFASLLAKNIVEKANTYYSELSSFKELDRRLCS